MSWSLVEISSKPLFSSRVNASRPRMREPSQPPVSPWSMDQVPQSWNTETYGQSLTSSLRGGEGEWGLSNALARMAARASSLHSLVVVSKNSWDSSDATSPHTGGQSPALLAKGLDGIARVKRVESGRLIPGKEKASVIEKTKVERAR